ncbi:MAG: NADH-ubiquinone oxidoreductase-F iron-sulfur binding region domain-containing protein [Thiovulaceae bacterium]|nr:NADH-ubiquinone oxidoreductase-F iron-sulfur binding region domain-containing protein [Sulfurimonadaceae bacterium]
MITSLLELEELANCKRCDEASIVEELRVCIGSSCVSRGADEIEKNLKTAIENKGLQNRCRVKGVGCSGLCANGTLVSHYKNSTKENTLYEEIILDDVDALVASIEEQKSYSLKVCDTNQLFFTKQTKIVLENAGIIDPNDIEDYIAHGGYATLFHVLHEMMPVDVINEVKISGLRGRGGGGFPTGQKWESVYKVQSDQKYIVCNGDEGDPGAFMDRALMEADPHKVLEGMIIAGFACEATKGYIYVRAEYPIAVEKINRAIKQARKLGILGNQIAHSGFDFDIEVRLGGGAFVCGEATALIASIEGNRGNPRQKPPHLSDYGLWGEPTVLNNVETLANIPSILKNGGEWFKNIGTPTSTGTKIFALTGHIKNTGLVEVPMGITLRELIFEIGGGVSDGKALKAIQTGGPSGGCIPTQFLDLSIDYDSLKSVGTIMGSGGMIVIDESSNMVELAHFFMDFCKSASCGKCVPCRVGTTQLTLLLEKYIAKEATQANFELLKELSKVVKGTSLCGLGQTAPNPVLSTIRYFESEYLEGIKND